MRETNFKQMDFASIPEGWQEKSLVDVAPLQRGFDLPQSELKKGVYPVVYSNGIGAFHSDYKCCAPGLITGRSGTLGKFTLILEDYYWPHNTTLWVTDFKSNNPVFLYYLYSTLNFEQSGTGTGVPTLNRNYLKEIRLRIPPKEEQERIAQVLKGVDDLIFRLKKLIEKKRAIKTGAMSRLLSGKLRLPGFSEPWISSMLDELGEFYKGRGISRDQANSGNIPAIRYGEIYTEHQDYIRQFKSFISEEVADKSFLLQNGDLCFTASGETLEEIGKTVAYNGTEKAYAGGDIIVLRPNEPIDSIFFGFLLNTPPVVKQKSLKGQGVSIMHIRAKSLTEIQVTYPSNIEEQKAIAKVLTDMDDEISALEGKLKKYEQLKKGMMQQLLTGKIRLVSPNESLS